MAKQKNKPQKKVKKAMRKAAKKGPFVAALAIIAGEVVAAAKRSRLDRRVMDVLGRAKDRLSADHDGDTAVAAA